MSESRGVVKFSPNIKFIAAVYTVELALGFLIMLYIISSGAL